jgi:D-alanine-D-alanine ligase
LGVFRQKTSESSEGFIAGQIFHIRPWSKQTPSKKNRGGDSVSGKKRLRVALLAGGKSGEREVSLNGAKGVEKALDSDKYDVKRYDPATDLESLVADAGSIDFAFILLHGLFGEDGTVQGLLELLGIPYQGSGVLGSALAMDKNLAKEMFRLHDLPVAGWEMMDIHTETSTAKVVERLGLPLVVKPVCQGSSIGMTIARTETALADGIKTAFAHDSRVMVEQFIAGREITAGVLGNNDPIALPLIEIIPGEGYTFFDYNAKYKPGASKEICPAPLDEDLTARAKRYGVAAHKALQLRGYSRTDMILTDQGKFYLLETNTIPGMTATSLFPQAAAQHGLDFPNLLERLIELGMEK